MPLIRDVDLCLTYAANAGGNIAALFHRLFPLPSSALFGSSQLPLNGQWLSLWIIFVSSEILTALSRVSSSPEVSLGRALRWERERRFALEWEDVQRSLPALSPQARREAARIDPNHDLTPNPFRDFDAVRSPDFRITTARAETVTIEKILRETFDGEPSGARVVLASFMQKGIGAYATKIGFPSPYAQV